VTASLQPLPIAERHADHPGEARPLDIIFIEGFVGHTVIGIYSSEQHQTQPLLIDLQAGVPRVRACDTDRIADTIDYAEVRQRLLRLMAEHRFKLLEAFAEAIADILIGEFGAHWVRVKVAKPRKVEDVAAMGVLIERRAGDRVQAAPAGHNVLHLIGAGMVPAKR
jgi:7,8-dihydroneopterin aldolase/epimerase/oxygenase